MRAQQQSWQYLEINLSDLAPRRHAIDLLNEAGAKGWEVISIVVNELQQLVPIVSEIANTGIVSQTIDSWKDFTARQLAERQRWQLDRPSQSF